MTEMDNKLFLTCEMCTHKYTNYKKLGKHYKRKHPEKDVLQCPLCPYVTINSMDIKQHRKIHHPGNKFVCYQCGFSSKRWSKWKEHLEVGHQRESNLITKDSELNSREINGGGTLNNCPDRKDTEVTDMVSDSLSSKSISCTECDRQYNSYKRLKKHYHKRHGDLDIQQCPFCQFVTPMTKVLAQHKRLSHEEMVILCQGCDFSTKKWLKWSRHLIGTKHRMKQSVTHTLSSPLPKLQCLNCGYASHSYKRLKKHYHKHHKEQVVFECPFCDYVTVESREMKHHKKTSHPQEQMCCSLCGFSTRKWTKWIFHQEKGHSNMTNGSDLQINFSKSTNAYKWVDKYTNQNSGKIVTDNFESSLIYVTGTPETQTDRTHSGEKETVHLPVTEIKDVAKSAFTKLRSSHSQITTYRNVESDTKALSLSGTKGRDLIVIQQLTGCDVVCSSAETVEKCNSEQLVDSVVHKVEDRLSVESGTIGSSDQSSDVRPLACETCQKSFKTRYNLKRHVMTVHSNVRNYTCSECSKTFKTLTHLSRHRLIHSDVRNYICSECEQAFKTLGSLRKHRLIHADEKCFKCSQCDFATNCRTSLKDHMNRHMGIRPYLCEFCDKSFISKQYLKNHIRIHTGERPYKCEFCDYAAARCSNYIKHVRIHLNIKPYKCTECDFSATQKVVLIDHLKTHTGEKPFVCPVCGKRSSRKQDMQRHIIAIHFMDIK